ncbi:SRPBCC family protein [Streptomyces sp. DSM 44915]|uniref:SRPBCC family protein n=1 Tax=Streptomyces chisholmiae TaxID=3075540 RepID=A0ABU2JKL1_9ACTN|nr:SRPBCC family protein [Streptomyces sp. DSM 44915]MDT0265239.1 SRPBCC family protein [Streptomyces sp. DSM 44915]
MNDLPPHGAGLLGLDEQGAFGVRFDRELRHPTTRVWAALTEPARLAGWLPGCLIEARVDGLVRFDFGPEGTATGRVRALRAPGSDLEAGTLEHSWRWDGVPESLVSWRLAPTGGGCRLTLTHREVPAAPARDFAVGWHLVLDVLTHTLAGTPADQVWADAERLGAHYAA